MKSVIALGMLAVTGSAWSFVMPLKTPDRVEDVVRPKLVSHVPDKMFVPTGFDDNDVIEVLIEGTYPNNCFRNGPYETEVDHGNKKIYVTNRAYYYDSGFCVQVLTNYFRKIELDEEQGVAAGKYEIVFLDNEETPHVKGNLPVAPAKWDYRNDYMYAPVDQLYVQSFGGGVQVTLSGRFTQSCYEIDSVKVHHNSPDVLEILPITKVGNTDCKNEEKEFTYTLEYYDLTEPETLIHVRTAEESKNYLYKK